MTTLIQAHRGASAVAPENTMEAFALALELGADGIELDTQLTADDDFIVLHDDTVDRTSNGHGPIAGLTLSQARELDFSNGKPGYHLIRIPTLAEVLEWAETTRLMVNIEIKPGLPPERGVPLRILNLAAEHRMTRRVVISSFDHEILREIKRIMPGVSVGALYGQAPYEPWNYAAANGFDALHPQYGTLALPGDIRLCHEHGVQVRPWTVDGTEALESLMRAGADAVITNVPDRALQIRKALEAGSDKN